MKKVMGLDASTSTIGLSIIEYDEKNMNLLHYEYYKPPSLSKVNEIERLLEVKNFILDRIKKFSPNEVAIEDFARFMKGRSGASTIIPLAILNRTICLAIYENLNFMPNILNVNTIRAKLKINNERPKKEDMPNVVAYHLNIQFPWIKKINKKNKKEVLIEENYDIADSISCACAHIFLNRKKKVK